MRKSIEHLRANPAEARGLIAELAKSKRELIEQIPINEWSIEISVENVPQTLRIL